MQGTVNLYLPYYASIYTNLKPKTLNQCFPTGGPRNVPR